MASMVLAGRWFSYNKSGRPRHRREDWCLRCGDIQGFRLDILLLLLFCSTSGV
ncbi:uncharacterized protein THITE_2111468 [Thermothielavioides terrestris NRRL 8126]|uniref:Uncharacterized protein n=1 Tax=Thermothielavioides terrestris (strain ATCC 38088 / NRRL 8126) TaxID=578455 RepID=G2R2C9_THETT|nr:uncharacterized protein THITE_2111468 [Thermothielavioides terrestris NRRL 8126]AEO64997.1 hypothetical protein THITE_2111468 [Thermothielavioides terrestris NRRL 8126]